jgi:uridine kinase
MIIHISGPSGSGKTTLLDRLKKKIGSKAIFIDTDEIDDKHALKLLKIPKVKKLIEQCNLNAVFKLKTAANVKYIKKMMAKANETGKAIIIVGLAFGGAADPAGYATKKYYIDTPMEVVYKRIQLRTLDEIVSQKDAIKKIINSNVNAEIKKFLAVHKLKIRQDLLAPWCPFKEDWAIFIRTHKKQGYKFMLADKIEESIYDDIDNA